MTVKELINELSKLNENTKVVIVSEFDGGCAYNLENITHIDLSSTFNTAYLVGEIMK